MLDSNCTVRINAVIYHRNKNQDKDPRYVQIDAEFYDCDVRRATFYLPYDKFKLKQIKKMCPWVYSYGSSQCADQELAILLEDFLDCPDLDPVFERIILNKLPPDFDNVYLELRDGRSRLLPRKKMKNWPEVLEDA